MDHAYTMRRSPLSSQPSLLREMLSLARAHPCTTLVVSSKVSVARNAPNKRFYAKLRDHLAKRYLPCDAPLLYECASRALLALRRMRPDCEASTDAALESKFASRMPTRVPCLPQRPQERPRRRAVQWVTDRVTATSAGSGFVTRCTVAVRTRSEPPRCGGTHYKTVFVPAATTSATPGCVRPFSNCTTRYFCLSRSSSRGTVFNSASASHINFHVSTLAKEKSLPDDHRQCKSCGQSASAPSPSLP
jgi:hypothetical protein